MNISSLHDWLSFKLGIPVEEVADKLSSKELAEWEARFLTVETSTLCKRNIENASLRQNNQ
jgi:hypothetical protein